MADRAVAASGLLATFVAAGQLGLADFHVAERLAWHAGERHNEIAKLTLALAMRLVRSGSVCLDLAAVDQLTADDPADDAPELVWPTRSQFDEALSRSALVTHGTDGGSERPLRLVDGLVYLERYWQAEQAVRAALLSRARASLGPLTPTAIDPTLDEQQRAAVAAVGRNATTVITGGPGTGKTSTAAGVLRAYPNLRRVAIAAPTGKAAARLDEEVSAKLAGSGIASPPGTTLHRLLGMHPSRPQEPRHHGGNPLPHDLVIVDETSMVSLTMMRHLLAAARPSTRLVFLGDRDQLASVDAGAVLADLVDAAHLLGGDQSVVRLAHNYRSNLPIQALASAIRSGDVEACLAAFGGGTAAQLVETATAGGLDELPELAATLREHASLVLAAAQRGDAVGACAALDRHRLLCAHREGPYGATRWNRLARSWLRQVVDGYATSDWYVGEPLLITRNSAALSADAQVWNGDTGVIIASPDGPRAAIARASQPLLIAPHLLDGATELHAMTIHKSQGSQFEHVSVILPPVGSPLLTRELLYTAVTRARDSVVVYGDRAALVEAVKTPARRASGLARQ